jgi:hypothetical protein
MGGNNNPRLRLALSKASLALADSASQNNKQVSRSVSQPAGVSSASRSPKPSAHSRTTRLAASGSGRTVRICMCSARGCRRAGAAARIWGRDAGGGMKGATAAVYVSPSGDSACISSGIYPMAHPPPRPRRSSLLARFPLVFFYFSGLCWPGSAGSCLTHASPYVSGIEMETGTCSPVLWIRRRLCERNSGWDAPEACGARTVGEPLSFFRIPFSSLVFPFAVPFADGGARTHMPVDRQVHAVRRAVPIWTARPGVLRMFFWSSGAGNEQRLQRAVLCMYMYICKTAKQTVEIGANRRCHASSVESPSPPTSRHLPSSPPLWLYRIVPHCTASPPAKPGSRPK